ncbi:substrate-binding domain-containing protein [Aggregatimonas sangjinii]|uniref:Substrate-binding domain-containing protein n=1 Tax=Aggregatimonas sangjinii TaxID=2583587 RepID=A0A5B7SR73_9FLAO|nr:substrate-binding domain-containing protein [Aggregatimonas sangjinii]QCW99490.1 substrate-binding domain-containing protein [Aggregatimonas sangjinii]
MKTIKDIAEEAEVSTGTVDRVIHDRPGVSKKTKEKIRKLLDKYDFERNILASTLALKKKYSIATLIPTYKSKTDFWYEPHKGLKFAFQEIKNYGVKAYRFYFDLLDHESYKNALNQILELNPDGVVFAPFFYNTSLDFVEKLNSRNIAYVCINIDIEATGHLSFIGQDSFQSGYLCGKLLDISTERKQHLAIILSKKDIDNHHAIAARVDGFMNYFEQRKIKRIIKKVYVEKFGLSEVGAILSNGLMKDDCIKGFFVPSSASYILAKFLDSMDMTDIHIVGFDAHQYNLDYLRKGSIDFLIDQNPFEQGYVGVKILFEYLLLKKLPKLKYSSPMIIVTKENIDHFKVASAVEFLV